MQSRFFSSQKGFRFSQAYFTLLGILTEFPLESFTTVASEVPEKNLRPELPGPVCFGSGGSRGDACTAPSWTLSSLAGS